MADAANKYPENAPGTFYVDEQCIDCDLCRETAPANYKRNDDGGHSYVYKQAESPEEEALCKEAMEGCPVEAIGNDGGYAAPARCRVKALKRSQTRQTIRKGNFRRQFPVALSIAGS